jgi:hypothetical protein
MPKSKLYDYFIHYNPYTEKWNAVKRDSANQYLNGKLTDKEVIRDTDINKLIEKVKNE